ncbi:MAG: peptidoglycan bridge formation glycyltransferase FemA/FemB family protein [Candidatus Saganbacteria bacterium]|nr:peptidoglycan bridge formation glycyltransferase FemA/FemB family protein [Candidatus Saganbacteria bacterium]
MSYRLTGETEREEFDKIAGTGSQVLQSYGWGEVKGAFGWSPTRVLLGSGGSFLLLKKQLPLIKKCFFYLPRGPLIDFGKEKQVEEFISAAGGLARKEGALFLRMDPEISEEDNEALSLLKSKGFIKARKEVQPRSTYILDLTLDLEKIKAAFDGKFRYNIHVAEKHGVTVRQQSSEDALKEFYGIYKETCSRQNFIIHPYSYYKKILEEIISKGNGTFFIAYHGGVPISGIVVFTFGKRAWYMYGASSNEYRNMMPNNLIHWEVIKWAKEKGLREYDLWGIPSNPHEKHPLWGVYRFKKGMGGRLVKYIGAYDLPFNRGFYQLFDKLIIGYQNTVRFLRKGTISDSLAE